MDKTHYENTIISQIEDLKDLSFIQLKNSFDWEYLQSVLPLSRAQKYKRVIISGCGDSYSAGCAMRDAFAEASGISDIDTPDPMEFIHYYTKENVLHGNPGEDVLIVCITASGGSTRHAQILQVGEKYGADSVLITNNASSLNSKYASFSYLTRTPPGCNSPGLRSYFASMMNVLALGCYIGEAKKPFEAKTKVIENQLNNYFKDVLGHIDEIENLIFKVANTMKDLKLFDIVGDGPTNASSLFIEQKFIECGGYHCTHTNSEEWVHISMMLKCPNEIGTVFTIHKNSPSFKRIVDTAWGACQLGRPTLIVTDAIDSSFHQDAIVCEIPECENYKFNPLMDYIPGAMLAGYITALNTDRFFRNQYDYKTEKWYRS